MVEDVDGVKRVEGAFLVESDLMNISWRRECGMRDGQ
jgi:hypothetical protein